MSAGPIDILNAVLDSYPLPEGISWLRPDGERILAHYAPSAELRAWLIKVPIDPSPGATISVSKRISFSIAVVTKEHVAAIEEHVKATIEEFQQALRDGTEIRTHDCGDLPVSEAGNAVRRHAMSCCPVCGCSPLLDRSTYRGMQHVERLPGGTLQITCQDCGVVYRMAPKVEPES